MSRERKRGSAEPASAETLDPAAFRAIAEFTYDWESWVNGGGRLLWVNAAVERITGYRPEECLAMDDYPLPLIHPDDRARLSELGEAAAAGESGNHIEFRILAKDGSTHWAAISYQPMVNERGFRTGYRSSVRDIEERKQMEARLREALAQAEEANRAKTRFLASVSHELRTPLQSLISHAELLARAKLPKELLRYAESMTHEGEHLARLVGDLLDLSALEAGGLTIAVRSFSPALEFSHRMDSLARVAKKKGLHFRFELGELKVLVESDPDRCLQILTNLASNAIQYTASGEVAVLVRITDPFITLEVQDTGPGLPPGIELFEPFRRGEGAATGAFGFGLGLAISARLCARLGGRLVAEPNPEGGTRMIATVPAGRPTVESSQSNWTRRERAIVLLIDDTASSREALTDAVSALGHEARGAASLGDAFSILPTEAPDLILLDLNMPGPEVTEKARALRDRFGAGPRLFVMSAGGIGIDSATLAAAGVDSFVQKPISLETLTRLLAGHSPSAVQRTTGNVDWSPSRVDELRQFRGADGRSLGERIALRLDADIAELKEGAREAANQGSRGALRDALHGLSGLAALLGASGALIEIESIEKRVLAGQPLNFDELERVLDAMSAGFFERFPLPLATH